MPPPPPLQNGLHVFNQLTEVGEQFGLEFAGAYTMDNLRLEKGYRHWGHELDSETSPLEARLMQAVDLQKVVIRLSLSSYYQGSVGSLV